MEHYRKNIIALTVALALGAIATQASARPADSIIHANRPVVTNSGQVEYRITLDPLYAATLEIPAKLKGFIRRALTADQLYAGNEAIEEPTVRYLAYTIADIIHKKPHNIMSWAGTEFRLMARPKEIQALLGHEGIVGIAEVDESEYEPTLTFSQSSPTIAAGDYYLKNEMVPWWVLYTNSVAGPFNNGVIIRQIDGPVTGYSGYLDEINYAYVNNGWDKPEWQTKSNYWGFWHSLHVAGVMGAIENNFGIRGINPGQPIYLYGGGESMDSILDRLNFIVASSESNPGWGVINISMNRASSATPNLFEFKNSVGRSMAIASNTNLVVQSAGNWEDADACFWSYNYNNEDANPFDGIIVVGGHDINGRISAREDVYFNNKPINPADGNPGNVYGSNYGRCVDLWAPSRQITSLRYGYPMGGVPVTQVLSGTSFAAPIAAAIAARYGNYMTRPIERESFLRAYAQSTGSFDPTGLPIKSVKWNFGNTGVLKRYPISGVWSPRDSKNIAMLYDSSYQGVWNSMGYEGTLVIDLGQTRKVNVIRVTPRSSVIDQNSIPDNNDPSVDFTVAPTGSLTSTAIGGTYYKTKMPKHYDRTPFSIVLSSPFTTQYLILNGYNHGSWLAYSEIEVYGY